MMQDDIREDQYGETWDDQPDEEDEEVLDRIPMIESVQPPPVLDRDQLRNMLLSELGSDTFQLIFDTLRQVETAELQNNPPENYYPYVDWAASQEILAKHLPNIIRLIILEKS